MSINLSPTEIDLGRIVSAVIGLLQGRSNAVGRVTLTPGATTTVVTKAVDKAAVNVSIAGEIFLEPKTLNAGAARATTFATITGQGSFTITHDNNAQVDRTFAWECRGG